MSLSTVERQHALTALAQAKQFEVLLSAHVVEPENALDHKHNSLVASVAQSVLGKADENAFRRSESERNRLEEIRAAIEKYRAERAQREQQDAQYEKLHEEWHEQQEAPHESSNPWARLNGPSYPTRYAHTGSAPGAHGAVYRGVPPPARRPERSEPFTR